MKKILYIFIFNMIFLNVSFSHDNVYVHQRIMIEAYKLLKIQFSKEYSGIADIDQFIGTIREHREHYWYHIKTLTGGSDHADRKDIVYHYSGFQYGLHEDERSHISITHFWDADHPKGKMKLYGSGWFPSAYTKSCVYIWDNFNKILIFPHKGGETLGYQKLYSSGDANSYLYQYYWKDKIKVRESYDCFNTFQGVYYKYNKKKNYYYYCGRQFCRELFFNILGRLCHLLTDMGVPEHVRRSMHIKLLGIGEDPSPFEYFLKDHHDQFYWTAEKVYKERGGFVNPFCELKNDKNLFPFYTMAQLSDWFLTCGERPTSGNDYYNVNVGEISSIINSYAPRDERNIYQNQPPSSKKSWTLNNENGKKFRDVLLPYTIRVVAGMLYKFIIEAKMQFPDATESDMGTIYDQQQELSLFNQEIDGNYYTFRAEGNPGRITVCPENRPDGYPADFKIDSKARNVTFRAAKEILFKPGFISKKGSQVHAYVVCGCSRTNQSGNCKECLDEDFNPQYDKSE